jgi:hypothetical protein
MRLLRIYEAVKRELVELGAKVSVDDCGDEYVYYEYSTNGGKWNITMALDLYDCILLEVCEMLKEIINGTEYEMSNDLDSGEFSDFDGVAEFLRKYAWIDLPDDLLDTNIKGQLSFEEFFEE